MMSDILLQRISALGPANAVEQENMLQELMQHLVLASLSRAGFFSVGCFHGGTCLRILYGTSRFSEDLDFLLKKPDPDFRWDPFLERIRRDCLADGIHVDVQDKKKTNAAVQTALLKTDSIDQVLTLGLPFQRDRRKKIRVKLEVDVNPPAGSRFESRYITFPMTAAITTQDLGSGFATKSHALLCRSYTKGRDWYDFLWYVSRKVVPDFQLFANALRQQGPWAGQTLEVTAAWYLEAMRARVVETDWEAARSDVGRFVPSRERPSLALWKPDLFLDQLDRLEDFLGVGTDDPRRPG
jgi:predicted nucleotidyltransferase component of viral defense system